MNNLINHNVCKFFRFKNESITIVRINNIVVYWPNKNNYILEISVLETI